MKVLVSGATGLVGSALVPYLKSQGHTVRRLVRCQPQSPDDIFWNPYTGKLETSQLEGIDAVINLCGENVAARWDSGKKEAIRNSRIKSTKLISETLAQMDKPVQTLINASAVGYYGDRGNEILKEESQPGTGFLAGVCREWEDATEAASKKGVRVVCLRIGVVLSKKGGALTKMLPPFQMGVGGCLGSGNQYMSWITIDDMISVINFALVTYELTGAVNAVTPQPVTNLDFSKALGKALSRPAILPVPAMVVRALMGEMADELLLASAKILPMKLLAASFNFGYPQIDPALKHIIEQGI